MLISSAMLRKQSPLIRKLLLLLLLLFVATARTQSLLVFNDTTGLPSCAYGCSDLYSAQYDCASASNSIACFCGTSFIKTKPKGWGCDDACTTQTEKKRVAGFLAAMCGAHEEGKGDQTTHSNNTNDKGGGDKTPNGAGGIPGGDGGTPSGAGGAPSNGTISTPNVSSAEEAQAKKAKHWWHKNWPYFFLAFMLILIGILILAFARPMRKFVRRQSAGCRARHLVQSAPPYWKPSAPGSSYSSAYPHRQHHPDALPQGYPYGSMGSQKSTGRSRMGSLSNPDGPRIPEPAFTVPVGYPYGSVGSRASAYTASTPPGIRTLFATQLEAPPSPQRQSWGQRIREKRQSLEGFVGGSRLSFLRTSTGAGGMEEKQHPATDDAHIGRAV